MEVHIRITQCSYSCVRLPVMRLTFFDCRNKMNNVQISCNKHVQSKRRFAKFYIRLMFVSLKYKSCSQTYKICLAKSLNKLAMELICYSKLAKNKLIQRNFSNIAFRIESFKILRFRESCYTDCLLMAFSFKH